MTAEKMIAVFNSGNENDIAREVKLRWLWQLDGTVYNELISTHEDGRKQQTNRPEDGSRELLVDELYDEVYLWYMRSRMHLQLGEIELYNNALALFQTCYDEYARYYNRTHMPKGETIKNYTGW